jgi:hypothetical protein
VTCNGVGHDACSEQHQQEQGQQQAEQQQQQAVVSIPTWLSDLAKAVCADILGRPDTFRYGDMAWPCWAVDTPHRCGAMPYQSLSHPGLTAIQGGRVALHHFRVSPYIFKG